MIRPYKKKDFNNKVSSLIITGETWQLHSGTNYQGSSITLGKGLYPTASSIYPIANDLSSVWFIGEGKSTISSCKDTPKITLM